MIYLLAILSFIISLIAIGLRIGLKERIKKEIQIEYDKKLDKWKLKKDAYIEAAEIVNELWQNTQWGSKGGKGPKCDIKRVNDCGVLLMFVSKSKEIPVKFLNLFEKVSVPGGLKSEDRLYFFNLLKKDLYGSELTDLDVMTDMPFIIE